MKFAGLLSVFIAVITPAMAFADSWNPWCDRLVVSPSGEYYVVMKRTGGPKVYGEWGPVEFYICKCGVDALPIKNSRSKVVELDVDDYDADKGGQLYEIKPNPKVVVRKGDVILGSGKLERPPLHLFVSDAGHGFVGLDVYGYNYAHHDSGRAADNAVVIVSASGEQIHRKSLTDLFTAKELQLFDTSAGGMWWLDDREPGWINERTKRLVLISATSDQNSNHLVRFVDWDTGTIASGPTLKSRNRIEELKRRDLGGGQ